MQTQSIINLHSSMYWYPFELFNVDSRQVKLQGSTIRIRGCKEVQ